MTGYAELGVTTNFTFLTGASHPEELVLRAAELGLRAIAITDRNSLAGVVRAWSALKTLREEAGWFQRHSGVDGADGDGRTSPDLVPAMAAPACPLSARPSSGGPGAPGTVFTGPVAETLGPRPSGPGTLPKLIVGARIVLRDTDVEWLALPIDKPAYQRLSQLLTLGKRRAEKGGCDLDLSDLAGAAQGMILIALPPRGAEGVHKGAGWMDGGGGPGDAAPREGAGADTRRDAGDGPAEVRADADGGDDGAGAEGRVCAEVRAGAGSGAGEIRTGAPEGEGAPAGDARIDARAGDVIARMQRRFPGQVFTGAVPRYDGTDQAWFAACAGLALWASAPMVAVGDVLMHRAARRPLADVLTCLREGLTIDRIGTRALRNAEHRLKGRADMARLFRAYPAALRRTVEIADRISFDLSDLSYDYPKEGGAPQDRLERLAREGIAARCPQGVPERYRDLLAKELAVVGELNYAPYFLTVRDIVAEARARGILCQGRGSAGNSIICWALGITDVDPDMIGMVFERFISRHRGEPPDIDVDFEHERREEIFQWIYEKYGRERAGLCATVIHFRSRAAIREVGKVMGLSADVTSVLAGQVWGISNGGVEPERLREAGLNPDDPRLCLTIRLIGEIIGFPRHLSQHVGGFVITDGRLDALCPIGNAAMAARTCIEWDKDDIDALRILKIDILSLGMLTCIRKAFDLIARHEGPALRIATVPQDDAPTYDMLCRADAVGVFQVESRAQMNFLPRMKPRSFYDLVIEVAIVRPGPIQGGMVKPYIRRRQGLDFPEPFGPALEAITRKTLGVPLFQEQALQIAVVGAGYSAEEADKLRRSLASFRRMGTIGLQRERFITGMTGRGYSPDIAAQCFAQIEGFADYGFPESHAAAFALLTYVSAWLKRHHPAIFTCALLNSQPMGFYAPAQLVRDLRDHGVEVRPVCVNHSGWDNGLERRGDGRLALRLGFRQVRGFREQDADWIVAARGNGYPDPESLWLRAGIAPAVLERLAEADAFAGQGLTRRDALWAVRAIRAPAPLPLFSDPLDGEGLREPRVSLPAMHLGEEVVEDYIATRLTLRAHPMELLRPGLGPVVPHDRLATAAPEGVKDGLAIAARGRMRDRLAMVAPEGVASVPPGRVVGHDRFATIPPERGVVQDRLALAPPEGVHDRLASVPPGRQDRLTATPPGRVAVAGLVITRQRPGTASGVVFLTLEDETGVSNIVVWPKVYARFRREVMGGRLLRVTGRLQQEGRVVHVIAERIEDLSERLSALGHPLGAMVGETAPQADAAPRPSARHPREQAKHLFPSRDFH
ncbi:error-prone DNA polymerase [Paenirhodobacter sp.]|uniref:error-prone DNA polymerase n=1 Tax=Paenirhodobacter sp. TaxID=1965326 RepID=UPI003B3E10B5